MRRDLVLPAIAAIVLAILLVAPTFSFTYLFDDYDFLGRSQTLTASRFLPDPNTLFYRPISREGYFGLLYALDPNHPIWGRLGNATLLALAVGLLSALATRLAGSTAGLYAGLAYASLGVLPILAGWTSGAQDLFAIVFVLASLHLRLSGRLLASLVAAAAALLSKETAAAFLPVLAFAPSILGDSFRARRGPAAGRGTGRPWVGAVSFGLLGCAWCAVHPGIRFLFSRGFESGEGAPYVTAGSADRLGSLGSGVATMVNWPVSGTATPWPTERTGLWLAASAVAAAFVLLATRRASRRRGRVVTVADRAGTERVGLARIAVLSMLLTVPALFLISLLLKQWQPYYLALPALGTTLLLGAALSRFPGVLALPPLLLFLAAGVWCRGMDLGPAIPLERTIVAPMAHLRQVEQGVRRLWPEIEGEADVYLSVYAPEKPEVSLHLYRFQILRVWYRDRRVDTRRPEWRRPDPPAERLAWVAPDLSVHEVDPRTLDTRSSGTPADSSELGATIRSYAVGLGASGETIRGVQDLLRIRPRDEFEAVVNRRLAAALWLADGRGDSAVALLRGTPRLSKQDALHVAAGLLGTSARRDIDVPVLESLGVAASDTASTRLLMRRFAVEGSRAATIRFARRLLVVRPGDWEATALLRWLRQGEETRRVTVPVVADSLW